MQSRNKYPPVVPVPVSDAEVGMVVPMAENDGVDPAAPVINSDLMSVIAAG